MAMSKKQPVALFIDRTSRQWIVRDREGNFWIVPFTENFWEYRRPFEPTAETALEPVPGHYAYLLGPGLD